MDGYKQDQLETLRDKFNAFKDDTDKIILSMIAEGVLSDTDLDDCNEIHDAMLKIHWMLTELRLRATKEVA